MKTRREEILRATIEAAHVFKRFPVGNRTNFDIVGAVTELGIPLVFRPLNGLWGATIRPRDALPGVLVTTKLGLAVQRFTLAHELGHVLLGHEISFDETVGFAGRLGSKKRPIEEIAADTFAAELLAPRELMLAAARAHGWTRQALLDPANVYQLSLRLGISFPATCWALASQKVMSEPAARSLVETTVKGLKTSLASESIIKNSWADVWDLQIGDSGAFLEAGPDDIFAIRLQDNASAGYVWELIDASSDAEVLHEHVNNVDLYGDATKRTLLLALTSPGVHRLIFEHRRPWNKQKLAHIDISVENHGKELAGLARRSREHVLQAAVG